MKYIYKILLKLIQYKIEFDTFLRGLNISDFHIVTSTIYGRKKDNNKINLKKIWLQSYEEWKYNSNNIDQDLKIIHNILYNYWIRAYAANSNSLHSSRNVSNFFLKRIGYIPLTFKLVYQISTKLLFNTVIIFDEHLINTFDNKENKNKNFVTSFSSSWRFNFFKSDLESITQDAFYLLNIKIKKVNLFKNNKDSEKFNLSFLFLIFRYLYKFPFMIGYFSKIYDSLIIYKVAKYSQKLKRYHALIKETYSIEHRSLCLGCLDRNLDIYKIIYNEDNILPYPVYSLNHEKEPKIFNKIVTKRSKLSCLEPVNEIKIELDQLVIQASDTNISSPTLYEYYCYKDIIKALNKLNYKGEVAFVFHPANSIEDAKLKKIICILLNKCYKENIKLNLYHRSDRLELFANKSKIIISIDYSQSYEYILSISKKLINFNRLNSRIYGPIQNKYISSGQYSDVIKYDELYNCLKRYLK